MFTTTLRRLAPVARQLRLYSSTAAELSEGEKLIHSKLSDKFKPTQLQVQDVSGGCGAFYAVTIASNAFKGLSTIKQHRMVTELLKKEIEGIHGIQVCNSASFWLLFITSPLQIKTIPTE
ncbi:bola-like protein [Pleurotus eryngii]|uniref:Bola-like protein n=1 Tax=Pleurotus eryngii TaxID=5323 RepID=A0A9P5ZZ28_PLEER|nr:bola-like protein [Pleurotus eryngii]